MVSRLTDDQLSLLVAARDDGHALARSTKRQMRGSARIRACERLAAAGFLSVEQPYVITSAGMEAIARQPVKLPHIELPPKDRIRSNVKVNEETGCWEWQKKRDQRGYGRLTIRINKKHKKAFVHRYAYELFVGPIPDGLIICHHCDNPPCCNPDHLYAGTHADNTADKIARGRFRTRTKLTQTTEGLTK